MNNKFKRLFIYIALLGLSIFFYGNSTIVANNEIDIVRMTDLLQQEKQVKMKEWSVYAREKNPSFIKDKDIASAYNELQKRYPDFNWIIEKTVNGWKAAADHENVENGLTESIILVTTDEKENFTSYLVYEVEGKEWNRQTASFFGSNFEKRINDIFHENPAIFSCIKGEFNDNMDEVLNSKASRLLKLFQAVETEGMREDHFVSLSAQTPIFRDFLKENNQMNIQLALRTDGLGAKTTFVVGTPIITFEY